MDDADLSKQYAVHLKELLVDAELPCSVHLQYCDIEKPVSAPRSARLPDLTRSLTGITIKFKKASKTSKRLEVGFNDDLITANFENADGLTHRWMLDREMYVIVRVGRLHFHSP